MYHNNKYATLRNLAASERISVKHEEKRSNEQLEEVNVPNSQIIVEKEETTETKETSSEESTLEDTKTETPSETDIKETISDESTSEETKIETSLSETPSDSQIVSDSKDEEYFEYYNDEEAAIEPDGTKAIGLWDFKGECESDLSFRKGDIVTIIRKYDNGWWEGELNGVIGDFPYNFVEVISQPEEDEDEPLHNTFTRNDSFSQLTSSDLMQRTDTVVQNDVSPTNSNNNNNARPQSVARALPIKQGYLLKKGHKRRNWKIRYFVLESSKLSYFANPADAGVAKRMKGFITLQKSSSVKLAPEMKRSNCFAILSDVKPFVIYMAAPTGDEMVSWMESLSVARLMN